LLPDDEDDAAFLTTYLVTATWWIDPQVAGLIVAMFILLTATQDQDVLMAFMLMPRNAGTGLIAQQGGARPSSWRTEFDPIHTRA